MGDFALDIGVATGVGEEGVVLEGGEGGRLGELLSVCAFGGNGEERGAWGGGEAEDWVHVDDGSV